ncbi:MAG: recombinase family protein [Oscillospiraceae bacterium]|nr:recombinase family protein [Oscillospiraceae bacterium]
MAPAKDRFRAAAYCRLSREDGDKPESDSIVNQQHTIEDFCARNPAFELKATFTDDGCTGTNFDRPAFQQMLAQIEAGALDCVIVKDLSRFGRDYIDMGFYLERFFPSKGVRFIAINDGVDSARGAYDMLMPLKNIFNTQYAKDISNKVKSAFRTKQSRGEFIGAFAAYGYLKDPADRNRLVIDPVAANTVQRIFRMAAEGVGKQNIADTLNAGGVPSPGEYKRLMGTKYRNSSEETQTRKWTYAAVDKVLHNKAYLGDMVSNRRSRATMHGKQQLNEPSEWIVVEGMHDAIISQELWETVQAQNGRNARTRAKGGTADLFAGFLYCGECGSKLTKTTWNKSSMYCCSAYQRYGTGVCTKHYISDQEIAQVVLQDINKVIRCVKSIQELAEQSQPPDLAETLREKEQKQLEAALERVRGLKQGVYEDYKDELLSRDEYLRYRADYDTQERTLRGQLDAENWRTTPADILTRSWVKRLIQQRELDELSRVIVAQNVKSIRVYEDAHIEITYLFSDELGSIIEQDDIINNSSQK